MAIELIQDLAFRQVSDAIMFTASNISSPSAADAASNNNAGAAAEEGFFGVMRRKWSKVQDVIQEMAAPLKRRSMYEELPEHVWPAENIEMAPLQLKGQGHTFLPLSLSNPTWCDYCGDFIWGLFKQCVKCHICQYTCHQHCVPSVTLNCKSISDDGIDVTRPSPDTSPRSNLARPGCARNVSSPAFNPAFTPASTSSTLPRLTHGTSHDPCYMGGIARSVSDGHVAVGGAHPDPSGIKSSKDGPLPLPGLQSADISQGSLLQGSHPVISEEGQTDVTKGPSTEVTAEETVSEKDETDSGYRSGTIADKDLPRAQEGIDRQELTRKVAKVNHFVPACSLERTGTTSFEGFLKVTLNLIRPITMELGARPPSIYELLTREHIIDENTQQVAFYMPRDTHKSLHINSDTTTKEVIVSLLHKFHILDHPRKFAMYEQEFNDKNKLVRLRRMTDKDCPLRALITWEPERWKDYKIVLQENETGEIVWDAFSLPELGNFLKVLDREEQEIIKELKHKYVYMRQIMKKRVVELSTESNA